MGTDSSEMPFALGEQTVRHGSTVHRVMVITPKSAMIIGRKRIDDLRRPTGISPVERWLIEQARQRGSAARIILLRAVNNAGERVWQFDPSLADSELEDGGYVMSKALLPFHRRLLASGVVLMVHTDWGLRECYAMRSGTQRALEELERAHESDATREVDRWVLTHMLLHAALNVEHIVETLLPHHLAAVERRGPRLRELIGRLPASAID